MIPRELIIGLSGVIGAIAGAVIASFFGPKISLRWKLVETYEIPFIKWAAHACAEFDELYRRLRYIEKYSPSQINFGFQALHEILDSVYTEGWHIKIEKHDPTLCNMIERFHDHVDEFYHEFVPNGRTDSLRELFEYEENKKIQEKNFRDEDITKELILQIYLTGIVKDKNFGTDKETREFKELCWKLNLNQIVEEELEKWNKFKEGKAHRPGSLKLLSAHKLVLKMGNEYIKKDTNLIPNYISDIKEIKERLRALIPKQLRGDGE